MAAKLNVLMVCRQHPEHRHGGLATAAWATARAAVEAGCNVWFVTASHPKGKKYTTANGVTVIWLPRCGHTPGAYPQFHQALKANFLVLYKTHKFDLIHTHSSGAAPLLDRGLPIVFQDHGLRLSMAQNNVNRAYISEPDRKKVVFKELHDRTNEMYFTNAPRLPLSEAEFLRQCTRVLVLNTETLWEVRTRYFLTNAEVFHYPVYGLEAQHHSPSKPPVIAFCASNLDNPEKGVKHGLSLLKSAAKELSILLIGPGKEAPKLARDWFPRVEHTGWLEQAAMCDKLAGADVFFECSNHHHGLNSTSVFALGLGVPVVGLPTPSSYEVTSSGLVGRVVSPFHPLQACRTILSVARDRETWSYGAQEQFNTFFSPKYAARALDRIYKRVT